MFFFQRFWNIASRSWEQRISRSSWTAERITASFYIKGVNAESFTNGFRHSKSWVESEEKYNHQLH